MFHCIQWLIQRFAASLCLPVSPLCLKFLDMCTVPEHDLTKRNCSSSCMDLAGKSSSIKQRQKTGMVNMCMGQQDIVNISRRTGNLDIFISISPLFHTKVHQNTSAADFQIGAAASDFMSRTDKGHFHKNHTFPWRIIFC